MSNRPAPWLTAQLFNCPLIVAPEKVAELLVALRGRLTISESVTDDAVAQLSRFVGEQAIVTDGNGVRRGDPYAISGGVAIVPVIGSLVNRGAWVGAQSGLVSYEGTKYVLQRVGRNPNVRSVVLDMNSLGGEAAGFDEMAAAVRSLAQVKPVYAVVNTNALSGGYAIVSGATRIIGTPTSKTGSIGVVMLHLDRSAQLEQEGVKPTLIYAGAHKVDANPIEPLAPEVRARLQKQVDRIYGDFTTIVGMGRGRRLSAKAARETQADIYTADDAVNVGLIDAIGTFDEVLEQAQRQASKTSASAPKARKGSQMGTNILGGDEDDKIAVQRIDATPQQLAAAKAEGVKEGAKAERDRISAVMADDKVSGKERIALKLMVKSPEMSAADIIELVAEYPAPAAAAPTEPSAPKTPPLSERAEQTNANKVGAQNEQVGNDEAALNEEASNSWRTLAKARYGERKSA